MRFLSWEGVLADDSQWHGSLVLVDGTLHSTGMPGVIMTLRLLAGPLIPMGNAHIYD